MDFEHCGCEVFLLTQNDEWRALVIYGVGDDDVATTEYVGEREEAEKEGRKLAEEKSKASVSEKS